MRCVLCSDLLAVAVDGSRQSYDAVFYRYPDLGLFNSSVSLQFAEHILLNR